VEQAALTAAKSRWDEDGWCMLEGAVSAESIAGAQPAIDRMFPSAAEMDSGEDNEHTRPWRTWDAKWPEFPFRSRTLNGLAVGDVVLGLARTLLESADIRLYLALVTAKYANQSSGYNQLLHADYPNHTLVVPRSDAGYQHAELFLYLSDVTTDRGATRMVSRRLTAGLPVERHTLGYEDCGALYDESVAAAGPAGSIVAYRPDVYHRSVDVAEPGTRRVIMHLAFRPAACEWGGYQAWAFRGFSPEWHTFVQQATPRQLAVLGFPGPGHPYWTEETIAGVGARYPGLDLSPWRSALG
jgi:ectoine hydroxylase-related dioxygenase (phytanoyl-CoA dioxygenase family)